MDLAKADSLLFAVSSEALTPGSAVLIDRCSVPIFQSHRMSVRVAEQRAEIPHLKLT